MLLYPVGTVSTACVVELLDIQVEPLAEISLPQLEVGAVQTEHAELKSTGVDGDRPVPRQHTWLDISRLRDGGFRPPVGETLEGIGEKLPLRGIRIAPKRLLHCGKPPVMKQREQRWVRFVARPQEIVIAGYRQKFRLESSLLEMGPELRQEPL